MEQCFSLSVCVLINNVQNFPAPQQEVQKTVRMYAGFQKAPLNQNTARFPFQLTIPSIFSGEHKRAKTKGLRQVGLHNLGRTRLFG